MTLQRLVLDFRNGELVLRVLYRSQDGPNPGTKARARARSNRPLEDRLRASPGGLRGGRCNDGRNQRVYDPRRRPPFGFILTGATDDTSYTEQRETERKGEMNENTSERSAREWLI